ncbi:phospholipase D-like domain-containing protein [Pseudomonas sp. 148P]|uniref:Phospholipase D-like domain-containing protein n=1 Tax=Pseudomonas ulcerans TaxID=3115852 RepID=A0ABU7HQH9_9PSED|nr:MULTISPECIES: phospholipase D-like domain-containing protein [unclassified Pseudomonas]MEE1922771.1 phospholipase D-like domain-containing protein [Pseudomonas sp. 147P]MEE1933748.1 phospholipase D-like domain-containing protein [Pseudomonas sp. 148P]
MSQDDIVVPICLKHTNQATCTSPWFMQNTEYHPVKATFHPLVNGEEAFRAVHEAIAKAQKSIDISCWGFQPSMYFIRDGKSPCIGELLRLKAKEGVKVRVLGWEMPLNTAGAGGEANLPGKGLLRIKNRALQSSTKEQYAYDRKWFAECSVLDQKAPGKAGDGIPLFVSRGFTAAERNRIFNDVDQNALDRDLSLETKSIMAATVTHHQKTVLVDYEQPEVAVGFVMGHNMLDEYWDTDAHSARNRTDDSKPAPDRGPRGEKPRQDISSRLTGPILEHLHHNFAHSWLMETGEELLGLRSAQELARELECHDGTPQLAQLLRTQAQAGTRDIERMYMQAANNATQFIYIENQYFRWPPFAEKIKEIAAKQTAAGRDPGKHGALHLFVLTNAAKDGIGPGTVNTQRMVESLGRADTMPEITKLRRIQKAIKSDPLRHPRDIPEQLKLAQQIEDIKKSTIVPRAIPGLKVHICSLVAPDTMDWDDWVPVYIHSKLMIVNDVFTTLGSANINTRSMQVDTEMNVAHEWMSVTRDLRRRLWDLHTNKKGAQDDPRQAFISWRRIMNKNRDLMGGKKPPEAPLVEFYFGSSELRDQD